MTTTTYTQKQPNLGWVFILVMLFIAVIVFATLNTSNSHAITKHGTAGAIVRECLNKDGPIGVYQHRSNLDKELWLCQIKPGLFGIQIRIDNRDGIQDEVTAYIKEKIHTLEDILHYIKSSGYIVGG